MKVLVAEDDPVLRQLLASFLTRWGHETVLAEDGAQAWEILQGEEAPRLAVLDWIMPGKDGVDICREVRKRVSQPYIYVLLLSSKSDHLEIIEGFDSGADDYLTKPFSPQELRARLRVGQRIVELEDGLLAAQDALQFKATHDPLTGVWNRAAVFDMLQRELARAHREGKSVGVLLADLDYFKVVNDRYGHPAGDAVLQEVTQRMVASVRLYDVVGRYGGEEFLIVLPGCGESETEERAEQIRSLIGARPIETGEGPIAATISVGAVCSAAWPERSAETFIRAADVALYRAKEDGRNRVVLATQEEEESDVSSTVVETRRPA